MTNDNKQSANAEIVINTKKQLSGLTFSRLRDDAVLKLIEHFSIYHDQQAIIRRDPSFARSNGGVGHEVIAHSVVLPRRVFSAWPKGAFFRTFNCPLEQYKAMNGIK